jgi:quercetin dioxygenase-like cupin family protein
MNRSQNKLFKAHHNSSGLLEDLNQNEFPARMYAWNNSILNFREANTSFYGYVHSGKAKVTSEQGVFYLSEGMYFCVHENIKVEGESQGLLIEQRDFNAFFQIGGPVESEGRLRYIDGCTDSLLIAPPVLGNPCLNLLNIPPGTFQSQHTHPSFRIGMILKGKGLCITPEGESQLMPGLMFVIPAHAIHSFKTEDEELLIIAYHPDSDFGPTHENHPMINRTILKP